MSPVIIEPTESQKQSEFAQLFEENAKQINLREGEIVDGRIVQVTKDYVIVDIGFKSEGQIPINEFKSPTAEKDISIGDSVQVLLETVENDHGMMMLSKERADAMQTWDRLVEVADKDAEIDGYVTNKVKGGLSVDIGVKAFLPGSQIDIRPARNLDKYVGNTYRFKILKLNKRRGNVVLSRKAILEKERASLRETTLANLADGQVFDGIVKNVTEYGVFVDLGGIDGLLHVTDMTWGRITHPSEMFSAGDEIRVVVLKFDSESGKVSLGLKQLQQDPWQNVEEGYPVGVKVKGKVVSLADYGAFISLEDGIEGLIHISEMSWTKKIKHPSQALAVEDEVEAIVLDVDLGSKRISLGLKQTTVNPWNELEEKFPLGARHKGIVRNVADFGVFVDVGSEIDGLVHISDLSWIQMVGHPSELYKKNDEIDVIVLHVDPENERFSLGAKQLVDDPWEIINSKYNVGTTAVAEVVGKNTAGVIVRIDDEVDGLITDKQKLQSLNEGDDVNVSVRIADEKERRFVLSVI